MEIDVTELRKKFHGRHYKLTVQRQLILKVFYDHPEEHLSAEEVYSIVKKHSADIGLATVYRTLEMLRELDILQKIEFGDGKSRYELHQSDSSHQHHHLICLECGAVEAFEEDLLETLETVISKKSGFQIVDHQVKFMGRCKNCQQKKNKN